MNNQLGKRLLTLVLALSMMLSLMAPATAYASQEDPANDPATYGDVGDDNADDDNADDDNADDGNADDDNADDDNTDDDNTDDDNADDDNADDDNADDDNADDDNADDDNADDDNADDDNADDNADDDIIDDGDDDDIIDDDSTGEGNNGEEEPVAPIADDEGEELQVTNFADFLKNLKVLEQYAASYAAATGKEANMLVLNYIRTGVKKYTTSSWQTMAGAEETEFVTYVAEQDAVNGTTAAGLRNMTKFNIPNGQLVEFDHMFATMNMTWYNNNNADLSGWAGDLSDLLFETKTGGAGENTDFESMLKDVRDNYLGTDVDDISGFGILDIYGDLDAFYLVAAMKDGAVLSEAMNAYFVESLEDEDRAVFFLNTRFKGVLTQEDVRAAIYETYSANIGCQMLDSENGITEADEDLKKACCYAFADYLFELADGKLEGTDEEDPENPEDPDEPDAPVENPYYTVFSSTGSNLAPGISQTIKYAYTADDKQIVYYLANVDITRDDVTIMANYNNADPGQGWAMQRVTDQAEALVAKHSDPEDKENYIENFRAIVATNGAGFNMSTGEPGGLLVMNGKEWHPANNAGFFGIMKDGSAKIGTTAEYEQCKDQVKEAIAGFGAVLIKDGKVVTTDNSGRASRTAIGIKANGSVVMMVLDGRQEPFSAGGTMVEIAQIMLEAGCVEAINLDGGGSTTFASKAEGSDTIAVVNRPSDGFQRSVSTSLVAVSTAETSTEFAYATISSEYDYLTLNASLELKATGVSLSGSAAKIPENAQWAVSDEALGEIENGVFTPFDFGDVEVQLTVDGEIVGRKILHVVEPDEVLVEKETMNLICGVPTLIPVIAKYQGNPVAFTQDEVWLLTENEEVGVGEGLYFTANEECDARNAELYVVFLLQESELLTSMHINLYKAGEAIFDFENVTDGNRALAWNREVSNAVLEDNAVYHVINPDGEMEITYTFGMDMESIQIPQQLADLVTMLPGSDVPGTTAWQFLLQLAERVSDLTYVEIHAQFDPNLDVDISEITLANEYFDMSIAELNEQTNELTIRANWVRQTQAIDPSMANPICILSGIKAKPKADAAWDSANILPITNKGNVTYDIYLRASQLYSFSQSPGNQEKFGLYPFVNENFIHGGGAEKGGHFASTYISFADVFTLDGANRQGWYNNDSNLSYYIDNEPVTGIQKLPGYEDPANKYYYRFDSDGSCLGVITGMVEMADGTYYAISGVPKTGWISVTKGTNVEYYYFDPVTGKAVDGEQTIDGYKYVFTEKKLTRGQLVKNSTGIRYRWAGQWATQEWLTIDGNMSYAQSNGYLLTGIQRCFSPEGDRYYFLFDENGVWQKDANGLYDWEGETYYAQDGHMVEYPGLVKIGEYYYYFTSKNTLLRDVTYWISKPNGIVPEGRYTFDEEGRMVMGDLDPADPDVPIDPTKNGIYEENGDLYYYENGVRTYAGLIIIDGYYYYVNTQCQVKHDCTYWISKTNDLLPATYYTFDSKGRIVNAPGYVPDEPTEPDQPDQPEVSKKNGFYEEDGEIYYYVDDVRTYAGLINVDGYYYYVNTNCYLVRNRDYWVTKNNDLLPSATYHFDEEGKMTNPPGSEPDVPDVPDEPEQPKKSGIYAEDGDLYYYENGVRTYAGLIKIDGFYYYVNTQCQVKHDCVYWISKTNGLLPETYYTFDSEGKIVGLDNSEPEDPDVPKKNGIYEENGELYYYVNDKLTYAGLIEIDGEYYYVSTNCTLKRNCTYWTTKTNGLLPPMDYIFDDQGRITNVPGVDLEDPDKVLDGIVKDGDTWYYYVDGELTYAGLIVIDGYYYYVDSKCQVKHDCTYWPTKNNGLLKSQTYTFDSEGRIVGYTAN